MNTLSSGSGDSDSGALLSKTDLPLKQERYESPYNQPSTSGHFISIFQFLEHLTVSKTFPLSLLYLCPARSCAFLVRMVQVGPIASSQADYWFIQAENGGLEGEDRKWSGS